MKEYGLFINGDFKKGTSNETFVSSNPAKPKEKIGRFVKGNEKDVRLAIASAKKAFPKWSKIPAPKRGEILLEAYFLLKKKKKKLGELVSREMGKVISEALGDVQEAIDITEYMAGEGRRLFGYTTPSELEKKAAFTIRKPLGVVGLISPWNFPIAIPSWKMLPALICGNTMVLKPSSDTPACAMELVKVLDETGIPKGVINVVTGPGSSAGAELVKNKNIKGISFTGSRETGEFVTKNAKIKKVGLELGGKNAIIVMDDANLDLAVEGVVWGAFGTTGQRCTAASRVIVHKNVKTEFEDLLVKRTSKLKLGEGINPRTDVGPLINSKAVEKSEYYVKIGKSKKAKLLCGGNRSEKEGYFFNPTIFTNVKENMRIAQEEIFGPVLSILPIKSLNEAIKVNNNISYGLSSAIYTQNINTAFNAIENLDSGLTYVNSSTIGSEVHLPFGGTKETGNGTREAGIEGIHEFSETKVVYVDYSEKLQKAQIDNNKK